MHHEDPGPLPLQAERFHCFPFHYLSSFGKSQALLLTLLLSVRPCPSLFFRPASPTACSLYTQDLALSRREDSRSSPWSAWLTLWGGVKSFWPLISLTETLEKILPAFLTLSLLKHACQVLQLGLDNTPKRLALASPSSSSRKVPLKMSHRQG